eukprot:COSAG01_NODE_608_length_14865_cov_5.517879_12_plen_105_part_00
MRTMRPPSPVLATLIALVMMPPPAAARCDLGGLAGHLQSVSKHCCDHQKAVCAKTGFPGHGAKCSEPCAKELEPFWDSCHEVLAALHMIPPGLDKFYDTCMSVL